MSKKKNSDGGGGAPAWMATFADMMSLLLTFFVLLLSFASMDIVKFKDAMGSVQEALGFMPTGTGMFQHTNMPTSFDLPTANSAVKPKSEAITEELEELVDAKGLGKDVDVENTPRGVILRVKGRMFFSGGTAELKPQSHSVLEKIADLVRKFSSEVSIEGHSDNIPVSGGRYASNWELSTARAISALKFLRHQKGIDVSKIHVAGFADTHPVASNDTAEGRAKNRRVEFVFFEEK